MAFIKNGLSQGFFALSLYWKRPLSKIFCFIALLNIENSLYGGFLGLYWKPPFSLYYFIKNDLYWPLLKKSFLVLLLYQKQPLLAFIENSLYQGFFSLLLYWKRPLSKIFCFIALLKIYTLSMISHFCNNNKIVF